MTFVGWIEIAVTLALVIGFAIPMGAFMTAIFTGEKTVLTPCFGPLERAFYRLSGVKPDKEQDWLSYTLSMVIFTDRQPGGDQTHRQQWRWVSQRQFRTPF